ncbi:RNA-binding protein [Nordella sp. HKS 07]|uniref:RNA-binding protein n=1 Tax=Nordella sp. HKS 07 TaxID=2712222 RepID=UPI0013E1DB45|nr:RNA-binding protein [Nordella sp. HKS 07]QIG47290.1 RNA-binding protein [Nordella sp. HKS 07]
MNPTAAEAEEIVVERMCIVTREVMDEAQLIRFVRGPDGGVVPDLNRKLPGRGVWVGLSRARVAEAVKRKAFARGLGEGSAATEDLPEQIGGLLRKAALAYISLAKKAGEAVAGAVKVEEMLAAGRARLVIHAKEAAQNGRQKIDNLSGPGVETMGFFTSSELDLAFGRTNVIHAAVAKGGLAEKLLQATRRMEVYEA